MKHALKRIRWDEIFVLVVATVTRFYRLGHQSLWLDEVHAFFDSKAPLLSRELAMSTFTPPGHGALLQLWTRLGYGARGIPYGEGEWWLRFPSAALGVVAVWALYRIARELYDERIAFWTGLLFALAPLQVWYSQEARAYGPLQALAFLSTWALLRYARDGRARDAVGYTVWSSLAVLFHYPALFLFAAHGLWWLIVRPGGGRRMAGAFAAWAFILVAVTFPLLMLHFFPMKAHAGTVVTFAEKPPPVWLGFGYTLYTFCVGQSFGPSIPELRYEGLSALVRHGPAMAAAGVAFGVPALLGLWAVARRRPAAWARSDLLVVLWLAMPLGFTLLFALAWSDPYRVPYNVRYALLAAGGVPLLLARGALSLRGRVGRGAVLAGLVAVSLVSLRGYYFDPRYAKDDARSAAAFVHGRARPGDRVVVLSKTFGEWTWRNYFGDEIPSIVFPRDEGVGDAVLDRVLGPLKDRPGALFLVEARAWENDPEHRTRAWLDAHMGLHRRHSFTGVDVTVYNPHPTDSPGKVAGTE
ncbi:MAG: glycosyltransferase family 39 protein [Myxococcales bacterium]|nr:glycosyltransferase family 39 protein [Myxococcales bacterium]